MLPPVKTFAPVPEHFQRLPELDEAWREPSLGVRLDAVRRGARRVRERLLASGRAVAVRTFKNAVLPYPARFAFAGAARSPAPHVFMENRCNVVQWEAGGRVLTMLFNPTDHELAQEAPFFRDLRRKVGERLADRLKDVGGQPLDHVAALGLRPEDVDYLAFDHLHTQDLRKMLGPAAQFPRARLIVHRHELAIFERLHPLQRPWYIEAAVAGVADDRFIVIEHDYLLGAGVALVRTPGHTEGNMSLAVATASGIWAVSENGVGCDAYAPHASRVPGVRRWARERGLEFVMNSNTLERSHDQYISMALERELVDRCLEAPDFYQHFSSSELVASPLAPLLAPTYTHGAIVHGAVALPGRAKTAA